MVTKRELQAFCKPSRLQQGWMVWPGVTVLGVGSNRVLDSLGLWGEAWLVGCGGSMLCTACLYLTQIWVSERGEVPAPQQGGSLPSRKPSSSQVPELFCCSLKSELMARCSHFPLKIPIVSPWGSLREFLMGLFSELLTGAFLGPGQVCLWGQQTGQPGVLSRLDPSHRGPAPAES